jgi:ribosomal protein S18 acetylase RimI-like enzyme
MEFKIHEHNNHIIAIVLEVSSQEFFEYLDSVLSEDRPKQLVSYLLDKKINQICLIKNIWVDENDRGKGVGKKLMNQVLNFNKEVPVLLLADYLEYQKEGFSLIDWYTKLGFETMPFFSISGPFLIKK